MARPQIEFLQAQNLPWSKGLYGGARPDVEVKTLSHDPETGASSVILRYPAGWTHDRHEYLGADEEFFVLSGELTVNDVTYGPMSFGHLPAGHERTRASSAAGAVVLAFFSAEPSRTERCVGYDSSRYVEKVDALAGEWTGNFHPKFPPGAGRKFLRQDPRNGEQTWVLGTMALRSGKRPEKHPVVEEMYLLAGEVVGNLGVMKPGAYFWRPPDIWHGPYGTLTGNLYLFRTKGGPLSTVYTDQEMDFSWSPAHRPVLPPELKQYGAPYPGVERW